MAGPGDHDAALDGDRRATLRHPGTAVGAAVDGGTGVAVDTHQLAATGVPDDGSGASGGRGRDRVGRASVRSAPDHRGSQWAGADADAHDLSPGASAGAT